MQCPLDFPSVSLLISLASVIGRQVGVRPKRQDDWVVVPNLWGAVIGRPGVLKTPAIGDPLRLLSRLEHSARTEYEQAMEQFENESLLARIRAKEAEKALAKTIRDNRGDIERLTAAASLDQPVQPG